MCTCGAVLAPDEPACLECGALIDYIVVNCPECSEPLPYLAEECPVCTYWLTLSSRFWERAFWQWATPGNDDTVLDDWDEEDDDDEDFELFEEALKHNLCCGKHYLDCRCEPCIAADEVIFYDEEYEMGTECEHCAHYRKPTCPPLVRLVVDNFPHPPPDSHSITPCSTFRLRASATRRPAGND